MSILLLIALAVVCFVGILLAVLQLPGTWIILVAAVGYSWHSGWDSPNLSMIALLGGMAVFGELLEFAASALLSRRMGASRRAAWYGLLGGLIGMFIFSLPVPVLGTIAGGIIGCFLGAVLGEMTARNGVSRAAKVGLISAVGRALGTVTKLVVALAMAGLAVGVAVVDVIRTA
jgi:uncharacterized protein YqgC (DUF456 family)